MALPPLKLALASEADLQTSLSTLFEPSPELKQKLVPQLVAHLHDPSNHPSTYSDLIDISLEKLSFWSDAERASFIASHPRIGEVSGLSSLSAKEQATVATPSEVLARLGHLNSLYEERYPGLRYVIFVDGRSRAEIIPLIEQKLGIALLEGDKLDYPSIESIIPLLMTDEEWKVELDRAVADVGKIAKSRLQKLGIE